MPDQIMITQSSQSTQRYPELGALDFLCELGVEHSASITITITIDEYDCEDERS
jgi:hypothetical protein